MLAVSTFKLFLILNSARYKEGRSRSQMDALLKIQQGRVGVAVVSL